MIFHPFNLFLFPDSKNRQKACHRKILTIKTKFCAHILSQILATKKKDHMNAIYRNRHQKVRCNIRYYLFLQGLTQNIFGILCLFRAMQEVYSIGHHFLLFISFCLVIRISYWENQDKCPAIKLLCFVSLLDYNLIVVILYTYFNLNPPTHFEMSYG